MPHRESTTPGRARLVQPFGDLLLMSALSVTRPTLGPLFEHQSRTSQFHEAPFCSRGCCRPRHLCWPQAVDQAQNLCACTHVCCISQTTRWR